jgi:hypothetical protein
MIVHYNVCDQCGNQSQLDTAESESSGGFEFCFMIQDIVASLEHDKFRSKQSMKSVTFCDKECLLEYLKLHLTENGQFKEKV